MPGFMKRPSAAFNPADGLLRIEQFQMAYATNDIDRACALFKDRFGIKEFRRLEGQTPTGGHMRIELAWVGSIMYELLTASGPGSELYMERLPVGEFAIKHHHLGFLIHDEAQWNALQKTITASGGSIRFSNNIPGFMRYCFVDVPELGHFFEYIWAEPAGVAFFEAVPAN